MKPVAKMLAFLVLIALLLSGCNRNDLSTSKAEAGAQIETWVPSGTSVADAQEIMKNHNFECSMVTNETFYVQSNHTSYAVSNLDYLYCVRRKGGLIHTRWQGALIVTNGKTSRLELNVEFTGP
jgi:hypothetical protein